MSIETASDNGTESAPRRFAPVIGSAAVEREHRKWWAVADDDVRLVTGYSCAPTNQDMWWCPTVGYSMSENHHLFETEGEAIDNLIAELERKIEASKDNIESLKRRRQNNQALRPARSPEQKGNDGK